MQLAALIRCWQLTTELHSFKPGATEAEIASIEQELGFQLPETMRELYCFSNGLYLCGGDVSIDPLRNDSNEMSLSRASTWLRDCHWPIPESVLIFGANGSGEPYGLWTGPQSARFPEPVIQVGEVFKPACMSVYASAILPFLIFETVSSLHRSGLGDIVQETLDVPRTILNLDPEDDETLKAVLHWADPHVMDVLRNPYEDPLDEQGLQKLLN